LRGLALLYKSSFTNMVRILFLSDNFPPEVNAPALRTAEHCTAWTEQGAEVTVITCEPNFPQGKIYPGYRNKLLHSESMGQVKVKRVWTYIAENKGFLKRTLDYLSFAFSAAVLGLFQKADVIVATSPQFFTALAGYALSVLKRRPWIFEVRDLWPESIVAVGAIKRGRLLEWLEKLEILLYRRATAIVVVTNAFKDNLAARGIEPEKIHVVKNGVDVNRLRQAVSEDWKKKLGLEGRFVVSYIGTHGMAHKLDFILQCAARRKVNNEVFLFVGDGAEKHRLLELAGRLQLRNVILHDAVPREGALGYLSASDVALITLKRSDTFKTVIPSKIFESAALQKPILLGVDGEARTIVEGYGAGIFFEPENEAAFMNALDRLKMDKAFYQECQKGCAALAADFDRERLARAMLEVIEGVSRGVTDGKNLRGPQYDEPRA
jgi:glycosyltransferase involved in cell wall biosynthesis